MVEGGITDKDVSCEVGKKGGVARKVKGFLGEERKDINLSREKDFGKTDNVDGVSRERRKGGVVREEAIGKIIEVIFRDEALKISTDVFLVFV